MVSSFQFHFDNVVNSVYTMALQPSSEEKSLGSVLWMDLWDKTVQNSEIFSVIWFCCSDFQKKQIDSM